MSDTCSLQQLSSVNIEFLKLFSFLFCSFYFVSKEASDGKYKKILVIVLPTLRYSISSTAVGQVKLQKYKREHHSGALVPLYLVEFLPEAS